MLRKNNSLILLLLVLAGCKSLSDISVPVLPGFGPHKINIQQGNVITQDMLDKLQPGMTRSQVRFVLGTPLLVDPFRTDRWDYVYTMNVAGKRVEQRQLKVYFADDKMVRYEGDVVADSTAAGATAGTAKMADKPGAAPAVKPEPVTSAAAKPAAELPAPATPQPAPTTPARDAAAVEAAPQLRLAPNEGEPAKPGEIATPAPEAVTPARAPEPLEAPPLPRLVLPPEQAEQPAPGTFAQPQPRVAAEQQAKPAAPVAPVAAKPEAKPAEKPEIGRAHV